MLNITNIIIFGLVFVIGAILGSFVVATVWRIRAFELFYNKTTDAEAELLVNQAKLHQTSLTKDYSRCLSCQHRLRWYDLVPVISWLWLRGRCRYCKQAIGLTELWTEIIFGIVAVISYYCLPFSENPILLILWAILVTVLGILFLYDLKWLSLPSLFLYLVIAVGVVFAVANIKYQSLELAVAVKSLIWSWVALGGFYTILGLASKERWVGYGDAYLATALALILANWQLSVATIFFANLFGCLIILFNFIRTKTFNRRQRLPFGPLLILGFLFVILNQSTILEFFIF